MSNNSKLNEFGSLRSIFFPIHFHELKKFLPMAFMMFFILFNYTLLRNVKDTVIMTGRGAGADVIPYVKLWGTTPSAILFMLFYTKITNLFRRENVFYLCIVPFLIFFGLYAFVMNPFLDVLHPNPEWIAGLKDQFPRLKGIWTMLGNWSSVLFYILAELWGSVILSLLFWQFANEISKKSEAKRFYPMFGLIGNIGLILSGFVGQYFARFGDWQMTLNYLMSMIIGSGVIISALYYKLNRYLDHHSEEKTTSPAGKKKAKLSMGESFKYIFTSPHLLFIAILVFSYGITINFMDVFWKGQVKEMFNGDKNLIQAYMSSYSTATGFIAIPLMLIGGTILRRFSWSKAASVTPAILMLLGLPFFGIIYFGAYQDPNLSMMTFMGVGLSAVALAAGLGYWQNAFTKATKYSLFDSTKEMAYMPLDNELRTKGKAAVDVVGGRSGKSGGSIVFVLLATLFPNISLIQLSPVVFAIFLTVLVIWFFAIYRLNRCLHPKEEEKVISRAVQAA